MGGVGTTGSGGRTGGVGRIDGTGIGGGAAEGLGGGDGDSDCSTDTGVVAAGAPLDEASGSSSASGGSSSTSSAPLPGPPANPLPLPVRPACIPGALPEGDAPGASSAPGVGRGLDGPSAGRCGAPPGNDGNPSRTASHRATVTAAMAPIPTTRRVTPPTLLDRNRYRLLFGYTRAVTYCAHTRTPCQAAPINSPGRRPP